MRNMTSLPGERVKQVRCTKDTLRVDLMDGRAIIVPLAWYPRLLHAKPAQRQHWQIAGGGYGIHWPDLDEDLSVEGLLRGLPAPSVGAGTPTFISNVVVNPATRRSAPVNTQRLRSLAKVSSRKSNHQLYEKAILSKTSKD
ncbi:MAG: DUF2442 domain-containing protein [Phycisphaerales bacterium]|nr:DUF2442 domain-containing protein [Phycisphaerales bacterium]